MDPVIFQQLGISLGLGLLVGLQREWADSCVAGIRTFALITLMGTVCALLAKGFGGWVLGAGLLGVATLMVTQNLIRARGGQADAGQTTEVAALVMFGVGAAVALDLTPAAVMVGGAVALLLHWKKPLHHFVKRIGETEIRAIFRLVLIALVVLPILPNRAYGPYQVLNPFKTWLMVVLICGISLGGYMAFKLLGAKAGTVLGGVLGGLISSTATAVSYARRSRQAPACSPVAALVVMIASTIVFARVAFEVAVVAPGMLGSVLPQLGVLMGIMALVSLVLYLWRSGDPGEIPAGEDPSDLKAAIVFGLLYAVVLFAVAAARQHFGNRGLYVVAALSGLTDMDAITLSTAQMINAGRLEVDTGWRMIVLGGLSNLVFKGLAIAALGHRRLLGRIAIAFGITVVGGIILLLLWPSIG